jgi:hypothetical protein
MKGTYRSMETSLSNVSVLPDIPVPGQIPAFVFYTRVVQT